MNWNHCNHRVREYNRSSFLSILSVDDMKIPHGSVPLTPDQASILTNYLYESNEDEAQLHLVLASITNAATFRESLLNCCEE